MLTEFRPKRVFIAAGYTDLRRGIDGLAAIVEQEYVHGKLFLQSYGKEFFSQLGKQFFNGCGKENFNAPVSKILMKEVSRILILLKERLKYIPAYDE